MADSGAFIKAAPLDRWSGRVFTVKEIVEEIRDANTRRRLQVLPFDLVFREPSTEALRHGVCVSVCEIEREREKTAGMCMYKLCVNWSCI